MEPASIRYNNPGAMWGGNAISKKWGEIGNIKLADGLHQNNHIAVFPDRVYGAAAQFDLWNHSYTGTTLQAAVRKWSGGNSSPAYMRFLEEYTGMEPTSIVSHELLATKTGLNLMIAQAHWEAGKTYPMTIAEWEQAQRLVFPEPKEDPNVPVA